MKQPRIALLAALVPVALSAPVEAADLRVAPAPTPYIAPPAYISPWAGAFIGLNAGYGWGRERDDLSLVAPIPLDSFNVNGAIGGIHAGYNFIAPNGFLIGTMIEFDISGIHGSKTATGLGAEGTGVSTLSLHNSWQAFAMGKVGYAYDRFLIYGTLGIAAADARMKLGYVDPFFSVDSSASKTRTLVGWAVGGGFDYAFDQHWTAGVDVRYADFGKKSFPIPAGAPSSSSTYRAGFSETLIQANITYHF